jgi:hypothetical protein
MMPHSFMNLFLNVNSGEHCGPWAVSCLCNLHV